MSVPSKPDLLSFSTALPVPLPPGVYDIHADHTVADKGGKIPQTVFKRTITVGVAPERFRLDPAQIVTMYPPKDADGFFSGVMPHVVFKRQALPWNRRLGNTVPKDAPWLALLVVAASDPQPVVTTVPLDTALKPPASVFFPMLEKEPWDEGTSLCTVLDVDAGLLADILPSLPDLPLTAHTRAVSVSDKTSEEDDSPSAAIQNPSLRAERSNDLAQRAPARRRVRVRSEATEPRAQRNSMLRWAEAARLGVAHEGRLEPALLAGGGDASPFIELLRSARNDANDREAIVFADETATKGNDAGAVLLANRLPAPGERNTCYVVSLEGFEQVLAATADGRARFDKETVRLVSLFSWQFTCADVAYTFGSLANGLNTTPAVLKPALPEVTPSDDAGEELADDPIPPEVVKALDMGYVPLGHMTRQSDTTISWYRGPLTPFPVNGDVPLPLYSADQALRYDPEQGMWDVSYAAAWTLGRTLALGDAQFCESIFKWRNTHRKTRVEALFQVNATESPAFLQAGELPDAIAGTLNALISHFNISGISGERTVS